MKIFRSKHLKPNKHKIILLIGTLLFFPSPIFLVFIVFFGPAVSTLALTYAIVEGMINPVFKLIGILFGLAYFSVVTYITYYIVCLLEEMVKKKIILYALLGVLIFLTSYFNLYWGGHAGGGSNSTNAIEFYKNVFFGP